MSKNRLINPQRDRRASVRICQRGAGVDHLERMCRQRSESKVLDRPRVKVHQHGSDLPPGEYIRQSRKGRSVSTIYSFLGINESSSTSLSFLMVESEPIDLSREQYNRIS